MTYMEEWDAWAFEISGVREPELNFEKTCADCPLRKMVDLKTLKMEGSRSGSEGMFLFYKDAQGKGVWVDVDPGYACNGTEDAVIAKTKANEGMADCEGPKFFGRHCPAASIKFKRR